jgi:hypothetical protein
MMLFMVQSENLALMTLALGTHESREVLDKEAMYGRYDPQVHIDHYSTLSLYVLINLYPIYTKGVNQAWVNIAAAYNNPDWHPCNPVIHPFMKDADGDPTPVANCSQSRFSRLVHIDPDSDTKIRVATAAFCQSLYRDIKSELSVAADNNSRSGCPHIVLSIFTSTVLITIFCHFFRTP